MAIPKPRIRLKGIPPILWPQARECANAGEVGAFFGSTDSMLSIYLLTRNWLWFKKRGLHAKALLVAWSNQKIAYKWECVVRYYLHECDRAELLRCSDPFPEGDTYTLYRGVKNLAHRESNPLGVSWTSSLEVAKFFTHGNGVVYTTTVKREDVYARIHESGRGEHEMLLLLDPATPLEIAGETKAA